MGKQIYIVMRTTNFGVRPEVVLMLDMLIW